MADLSPGLFGVSAVIASFVMMVIIILILLNILRSLKELSSWIGEVSESLEGFMTTVAPFVWRPQNIAVIASGFKIDPREIDFEYRKELDAKQWIVRNTFPENELTSRFLNKYSSEFLNRGYDMVLSPKAGANEARQTESTASIQKASSKKQ